MELDWHDLDRWLMGEAWVGSSIHQRLLRLCDDIGPRWSSTRAEAEAVAYIRDELDAAGLSRAALEEYTLDTWALDAATATIIDDDLSIPILPFNRCPSFDVQAPVVDVGYGTPHRIESLRDRLPGSIAVMQLGLEPFTAPVPQADRLKALAASGVVVAIVVDRKEGGRVEYHNAGDWRESGVQEHPLPTVAVTREVGARLCRSAAAGKTLRMVVESRFYSASSWNVAAALPGARWGDEHLLIGGHHDTVYGSPGGNDNATSIIAVLETARVLARLQQEKGVAPGRTIRFATFGAEEQQFQGASAFVAASLWAGNTATSGHQPGRTLHRTHEGNRARLSPSAAPGASAT